MWARPEVWAAMRPIIPSFMAEELYLAWTEDRPPKGPPTASWFSPGGFQAFEHYWAVSAAVQLHQTLGWQRISARIRNLNGHAMEELAKMPHVKLRTPRSSNLSAGIICFEVDGMKPEAVVSRLRQQKIIASTSPYRISYPRLSFGIETVGGFDEAHIVVSPETRAVHGLPRAHRTAQPAWIQQVDDVAARRLGCHVQD